MYFTPERESKIYKDIVRKINKKLNRGVKAHSLHIPYKEGMKEYVKMHRWIELNTVIQLKSEPFDTLFEAQYFSDCFNDSFLYDSFCKEEDGCFYVYSDWVIKSEFVSYSVKSKGLYWEFANWS